MKSHVHDYNLSIVGAISTITLFMTACALFDPCGEDATLALTPSPSGRLKAVVYLRDCGATTEPTILVAILPESSNAAGLLDIAAVALPGSQDALVLWSHGDPPIKVSWSDDSHITVRYHDIRIKSKKTSLAGVAVGYEEIKNTGS